MVATADLLLRFIDDEQSSDVLPKARQWDRAIREDGTIAILPERPSPFLFRGQTSRYTPCYPSIVRRFARHELGLNALEPIDQAKLVVNVIRSWWFAETLKLHPAMKWAASEHISVDPIAIAQHYGIPTGYIDLTESVAVAAFFATCAWRNGGWTPVTSGEGVLYRLAWAQFPEVAYRVRPIALQPFPRPREQWGWTIALHLSEDFESLPLQAVRFAHSARVSQRVFDMFDGGSKLFPPDVMHEAALKINSATTLPKSIAQNVSDDFNDDPQGLNGRSPNALLEFAVNLLGVNFTSSPPEVFSAEIADRAEMTWQQTKDSFYRSVGFRMIREPKNQTVGEQGGEPERR